jgi:hypothetical protein
MNATEEQAEIEFNKMKARTRLKEAGKWLTHIGGLPQGFRGEQILRWGADQAWLAAENDRMREPSVRNWCRSKAPSLTKAELDALVAYTATSNKNWTNDQCATVLGIGWRDTQEHGFKFIGADDDDGYKNRNAMKAEKHAARSRKYRAARSTGAKRGRPASTTGRRRNGAVPRSEWLLTNNASQAKPWVALGESRASYYRRIARETQPETGVTLNTVTPLNLKEIGSVTHFPTDLSHDPQPPDRPSRSPQATRRQEPIIIDIIDSLDDGGGLRAPPPTYRGRYRTGPDARIERN